MTHEPLTFGYVWKPKSSPNALFPSMRAPTVRKYRSLKPNSDCPKAPPVMTRCWFSSAFLSEPLATVGSPGDGKFSLKPTTSLTSEFTY